AGRINYKHVKENYRAILADFAKIPRTMRPAVKVGIVGEIFVKYSPLANNHLEDFLISEGAEPVVPGLLDFMLYSVYDSIMDYELYGLHPVTYAVYKTVYKFFCKKKDDMIAIIKEQGIFDAPAHFQNVTKLTKGYISNGVKMGEGWLLTAEMLELAQSGAKNIVCTQPFGCLPNHICGKGMMRPLKEGNPDINIVAIDYDAGATRVNQENRLKLMLANARMEQTQH
ncbi:MAG: 2-hydroxyglutaryl-CoA dehydratase, partial [Clostridia bacterium]|nr:2-hydroxyglutaryl-CoA dehydratase [Clostridia bacterium]